MKFKQFNYKGVSFQKPPNPDMMNENRVASSLNHLFNENISSKILY